MKPTIVIVPGSFSPASFYDDFISKLSDQGYSAIAVDLPSVGGPTDQAAATMADDAVAVQQVVSKLADQGRDIVLVSHSYGGIPATEGAHGLSRKDREASGKKGGITGLVYVTALLVGPGQSLGDVMGSAIPDYVQVNGDFMSLKPIGNSTVTFSDLPKDEAEAWAAKTPHHSTVTFGGQLTYPMYHQIPTTYVHMLDDKTIPLEMQKGMVEAANKDKEGRITTYSMNGGHFPFISRPEELAKVVIKAAEATA